MRLYYQARKEELRARSNQYYWNNRDKVRSSAKLRHQATYVRRVRGKVGTQRYEAQLAGFRSKFEQTLDIQLKRSGVDYSYETLQIPYVLNGVYNPDFILEGGIIIEAKGILDRESKRKMLAVKNQHPEFDVRIVFMEADKKVPGTKQTHAQWADRNGYMWAHREIPEEWLLEQ